MPVTDGDQTCLDFRLTTDPPAKIFAFDLVSGRVHAFSIRSPHTSLGIFAEALVVTHRVDPFVDLRLDVEDGDFYQREQIHQKYIEYLLPTARVPLHEEVDRIASIAKRQAGTGAASFLIALTRLLHRAFEYVPGATTVTTSLHEVLETRQGVCQDFAHLMLAICRRQGIPARYVSGYLYTGAGKQGGGSTGEPLRAGNAMHAWVECLLPDETWHGFDPTNSVLTNDYYIKVHYGRDYGDVVPMKGVYRGPDSQALAVSVRVAADPH